MRVTILAILALTIGFCAAQKTISMDLHRRELHRAPFEVGADDEIISEEEAKRRGLATIEKTMTNYANLQYYATLYIGDSQKEMTFIWDTGSTFLWFPMSN